MTDEHRAQREQMQQTAERLRASAGEQSRAALRSRAGFGAIDTNASRHLQTQLDLERSALDAARSHFFAERLLAFFDSLFVESETPHEQ